MNPIKHKLIIDITAEETGFPLSVVRTVIDAYYSELHRNMSKVTAVNININGLGTVSVKRKSLKRKIQDTQNMIGHLERKRENSVKSEIIYQDKVQDLKILDSAFVMLEEEREARGLRKEAKQKYYEDKCIIPF